MEKKELKDAASELLAFLEKKDDVKHAEAYCSANRLSVYRIVYHSQIPSNALEEPKSEENFGLSARIHFTDGAYGFGAADSYFGKDAFKEAYEKAKRSKVHDKDFKSFPKPQGKPVAGNYVDQTIAKLDEQKAIKKSYGLLDGALSVLSAAQIQKGINLTGELDVGYSSFAVKSTQGIDASEENTFAAATLTSTLEDKNSSGVGGNSATHLLALDCESAGKEAAQKALRSAKTIKVDGGDFKVILSPNAVGELFYSGLDLALPSIDFNASPFIARMGKKVGSELLTVHDNANLEGFSGSKIFTDEGLPAGRTTLIENGVLKNYITNHYYREKKEEWNGFVARNGFRGSGERKYYSEVGVHGTNIEVTPGDYSETELLKETKNGLYIGRLWYTYPINGYSSPDFTSTVRGDSFVIKNGEIAGALAPNTLRVLGNFDEFLENIKAIGRERRAVQSWGQDEIVITPEMCLSGMKFQRISNGIY
ncbi:MAG: TldD/PmbA family protein [archaeon]|nr:TldD/PmbA family protein [archaeon]